MSTLNMSKLKKAKLDGNSKLITYRHEFKDNQLIEQFIYTKERKKIVSTMTRNDYTSYLAYIYKAFAISHKGKSAHAFEESSRSAYLRTMKNFLFPLIKDRSPLPFLHVGIDITGKGLHIYQSVGHHHLYVYFQQDGHWYIEGPSKNSDLASLTASLLHSGRVRYYLCQTGLQ